MCSDVVGREEVVADEQDGESCVGQRFLNLVMERVADADAFLVEPEAVAYLGNRFQNRQQFIAVLLVFMAIADEHQVGHWRTPFATGAGLPYKDRKSNGDNLTIALPIDSGQPATRPQNNSKQ